MKYVPSKEEKAFNKAMGRHLPDLNDKGPQHYSTDEFLKGMEAVLREIAPKKRKRAKL